MTIPDQLNNLNPFTAKKRAHEAEKSAAYDVLQGARRVKADLDVSFTAKNKELEAAEIARDALALAATQGDTAAEKAYAAANIEVERLAAELKKTAAAQKGASLAITNAERELRTVSHQDRVKELSRFNNAALKVAAEIEELVAALHEKHTKLAELGRKRQWSWPDKNPPKNALLYEVEVTAALSHAFARASLKPFVDRISPPQLPGSECPWEVGRDRSQIKSLSATVQTANEFLLKALDELPLPGVEDAAKEIEPAPVAATVAQPKPTSAPSNGETYDARNYAPPKTSVRI
jgi:hypothetical protein